MMIEKRSSSYRWRNGRATIIVTLGILIVFVSVTSILISHQYGTNVTTPPPLFLDKKPSVATSTTTSTTSTNSAAALGLPNMLKNKQRRGGSSNRYKMDALCTACRFANPGPNAAKATTCQLLFVIEMRRNKNLTLLQAAQSVAAQFPDTCGRCDPQNCPDSEKIYWRLDQVAPPVLSATTHYLQSIAAHHRIPRDMIHQLALYAADDANVHPNKTHLFEFNPSIVQLPPNQIPPDLPKAVYLASFRVTSAHNCVPDPEVILRFIGGSYPRPKFPDFLAMAVLDADLNILRQAVMDVRKVMPRFEDARLFVLQQQLYITTYSRIHPIWIVPPPTVNNETTVVLSQLWPNQTTTATSGDHSLQVTFRKWASCTTDPRAQQTAKNLNYFIDADNRTVMELEPMGSKEVINLQAPCIAKEKNYTAAFIQRNSTLPLPPPTFATMDELYFGEKKIGVKPPYTQDRGSACCVSIPHPTDGRPLLLGIAHLKTRHGHTVDKDTAGNIYLSNFYVMESKAPYHVVARTGNFCLGFSQPNERGGNPYARLQMDPLRLGVTYDACPRIHFVSGMVQSVKNPAHIIIAYGLQDCVPRMITVQVADVLRMLFAPQEML